MKNILSTSVLVGALLFGVVGIASAHDGQLTQNEFQTRAKRLEEISERMRRMQQYESTRTRLHGAYKGPTAPVVPELDPSAAASVAALVLAGALVLSQRRKASVTA